MDMMFLEREYHTEKRIGNKKLLRVARGYYDRYADSRAKPFEEIDVVACITSGCILSSMNYDVERMFKLFEMARLYAGKEF